MIPSNITAEHVRLAMDELDRKGIPSRRDSRNWTVLHGMSRYPPKYLLSIANRYANGAELHPNELHANQTHPYFQGLGFIVVGQEDDESGPIIDEEGQPSQSTNKGYIPDGADRRDRMERPVYERSGQGHFRNALLERYQGCCLITGCRVVEVLEAAHIVPYRGDNDNHLENGLLLRADIHTLFDRDLIGVQPDNLNVKIHPSITGDYGGLVNKALLCPDRHSPSRVALRLRYNVFCERLNRSTCG